MIALPPPRGGCGRVQSEWRELLQAPPPQAARSGLSTSRECCSVQGMRPIASLFRYRYVSAAAFRAANADFGRKTPEPVPHWPRFLSVSAQIIPFPTARAAAAQPVPPTPNEMDLPISLRASDGLTAEDVAAIEGHLPRLRGSWSLVFVEDQDKRLSAVLHKSSGWEAFRRTAVVQRLGNRLSAFIRSRDGRKPLGEFETATLAVQAIGATVGLGSRIAAPKQVKAVTGRRSKRAT